MTKIVADLQVKIEALEKDLAAKDALLRYYEEQFRLGKQRQFGPSRETTPAPDQINLFNEAEVLASPNAPEPSLEEEKTEEEAKPHRKPRIKPKGKRVADLKGLPINRIEHRLPEEDQFCPCCSGPLHEMSFQIHREVRVIPASVEVDEHAQCIYSCRQCELNEIKTPIVVAPMPTPVIPHSLASASAISHVIVQKYVEGLPLYRQEQQFERFGIPFSRQNMANWIIIVSESWMKPLYDRMHKLLLLRDILHADETPFQVLNEPGRKATTNSYMWLYRTGREGPSIVLYEYKPTRSGENPKRFLNGFTGYIHVDCYAGYNKLPSNITLVGCWAHARRYFVDTYKALPQDAVDKKSTLAYKGIEFCDSLFDVERSLKEKTPQERMENRQKLSQPILDQFKNWLDYECLHTLPKSAIGKAVNYCLNNWDKLKNFMLDGRLELDNNRGERSIKPFVIGRKGWLFSASVKGATASATLYSIVETAKENGMNPFYYLEYILERLPNIDTTDVSALDALLPWSESLPGKCRMPYKHPVE